MCVVPPDVRDAAVAAFGCRLPGVEVLYLTADVVQRLPPGRRTRRLRFDGARCAVLVEVRGQRRLALDVRLRPDDAAQVELLQVEGIGSVRTRGRGRQRLDDVSPGLTSLLVRWPDQPGRTPVRTAWMLL